MLHYLISVVHLKIQFLSQGKQGLSATQANRSVLPTEIQAQRGRTVCEEEVSEDKSSDRKKCTAEFLGTRIISNFVHKMRLH
jgi:hypothetical protein